MKRIIVSSKDGVKLDAVLEAFQKVFPQEQFFIEGVSSTSENEFLPKSSIETYSKAWTGMYTASTNYPTADFYVGIENGIEERNSDIASFTWCTILGSDGTFGKSRSSLLFLPSFFQRYFQENVTIEHILQDKGSHLGKPLTREFGIAGLFTGNNVTQRGCVVESAMLALSPFKNKRAYYPIVISFLGSMVGNTDTSNLYRNILHTLKKYGVVMTGNEEGAETASATSTMFQDIQAFRKEAQEAIEKKEADKAKHITESDLIIVEASMLDFTIGYQLGTLESKKPILCLCQSQMDTAHLHSILKDSAYIHMKEYTSLAGVDSIVQSFLNEYF